MKIAVFCSANDDIDERFFPLTEELGRWIGQSGNTLVYGGCNTGLMECVGKAAHASGATTIGVIPDLVEKGGRRSDYVDVEIPCDSLSLRKDIMTDQADVAVALPGGIGTLDEIFTLASSATIGYHKKQVILYNMYGSWDSLISLLDDLEQRGMTRGSWRRHIVPANTLAEVASLVGYSK